MKFENVVASAVVGALAIVVFTGFFWWKTYTWSECRAVHGWPYCVAEMLR
jgi:hypothetical protein